MSARAANVELLAALSRVLRRRRIRWFVFGAQASVSYGRPRMTADVDVTVNVAPAKVAGLVRALTQGGFAPRVSDLESFIRQARVIPFLHLDSRMPLDLVLAGPGLEQEFFERVRRVEVGGLTVPMISPEDLVVTKLLAGRPTDLADVEGIVDEQGALLDVNRVRALLRRVERELDQSDLMPMLERILARRT